MRMRLHHANRSQTDAPSSVSPVRAESHRAATPVGDFSAYRPRSTSIRRLGRQAGFTLLELSVVAIITVLLSAFAAKAMVDDFQEGIAESTGTYFFALKSGLEDYIAQNVTALSNNTPVAGYANPLAPTLAELKTAGHIENTLPAMTPFKQTLTFVVTRSAACPNPGCLISSYVYGNTPVNIPGARNSYLATIVRSRAQGYGIASDDQVPGQLRGQLCAPLTNPAGSTPYMIGACTVLNAGFYAQFVRRGDDRVTTLNNDLNVNGTMTASQVVSNGNVSAPTGNIGAGTGGAGCRLAELISSGQIVSRSADCISRAILENNAAGGRLQLMNAANQSTVQLSGDGTIVAGNGTASTVQIEGAAGRITTNGYAPTALPTGWAGGVNTFDVAARGTVGTWDGTNLRATMSNDGFVRARDAAGAATAELDGTSGRVSGNVLRATQTAVIGAACTTAGDQRQRSDASGAYATCQGGVWVPMGSKLASVNAACTTAGEGAVDNTGQMLVCKQAGGGPGGFYLPAKNMFSDFVFLASSMVTDGSIVPKPACANLGGAPGVPLIFIIGQTEGSPDGAYNRYAVDGGASWTVRLKRGDDSTALAGASALAQQYCYYPS